MAIYEVLEVNGSFFSIPEAVDTLVRCALMNEGKSEGAFGRCERLARDTYWAHVPGIDAPFVCARSRLGTWQVIHRGSTVAAGTLEGATRLTIGEVKH